MILDLVTSLLDTKMSRVIHITILLLWLWVFSQLPECTYILQNIELQLTLIDLTVNIAMSWTLWNHSMSLTDNGKFHRCPHISQFPFLIPPPPPPPHHNNKWLNNDKNNNNNKWNKKTQKAQRKAGKVSTVSEPLLSSITNLGPGWCFGNKCVICNLYVFPVERSSLYFLY